MIYNIQFLLKNRAFNSIINIIYISILCNLKNSKLFLMPHCSIQKNIINSLSLVDAINDIKSE